MASPTEEAPPPADPLRSTGGRSGDPIGAFEPSTPMRPSRMGAPAIASGTHMLIGRMPLPAQCVRAARVSSGALFTSGRFVHERALAVGKPRLPIAVHMLDFSTFDARGIRIVDGEYPGSTYYAAELTVGGRGGERGGGEAGGACPVSDESNSTRRGSRVSPASAGAVAVRVFGTVVYLFPADGLSGHRVRVCRQAPARTSAARSTWSSVVPRPTDNRTAPAACSTFAPIAASTPLTASCSE